MIQLLYTTDLSLAAALFTLGIPFNKDEPFSKVRTRHGVDHYTFFFEDVSKCGTHNTSEMMKAWKNDAFDLENPEHPFSYIKHAFKNREFLLDKVNQSIPMVIIERDDRFALIPADASDDLQEKIFSQF